MKRHLLTIVLFLLLGVVVNVAVAWGLAVGVPLNMLFDDFTGVDFTGEPNWWSFKSTGPGAMLIRSRVLKVGRQIPQQRHVPGWSRVSSAPTLNDIGAPQVTEQARGFPMLSLYYRRVGLVEYEDCFRIPLLSRRPVPLRPIWPGFVINTLFCAAILWLLIPGPFALRRFIRRRRGLCPKCGYPMGESAVCSECGVELGKRAAAGEPHAVGGA